MTFWTRLAPPAACAALLSILAFVPRPAAAEPVDLELVLAADGSGSIDEDEFMLQRRGYAEAITSRPVLAAIAGGRHGAIALAYVEWAAPDSVHTIVDWAVIRGPAEAADFAARLMAAPAWRGLLTTRSRKPSPFHPPDREPTPIMGNPQGDRRVRGDGPQSQRPAAAAHAGGGAERRHHHQRALDPPRRERRPGPRGEALGEHYANESHRGRSAPS